MATIHRIFPAPPPHRWHPLKDCAEPRDYLPADLVRRRVADEPIDLFDAREKALLAEAGYPLTLWERLGLDAGSFVSGAVAGAFATLALLVAPFVLGLWS